MNPTVLEEDSTGDFGDGAEALVPGWAEAGNQLWRAGVAWPGGKRRWCLTGSETRNLSHRDSCLSAVIVVSVGSLLTKSAAAFQCNRQHDGTTPAEQRSPPRSQLVWGHGPLHLQQTLKGRVS